MKLKNFIVPLSATSIILYGCATKRNPETKISLRELETVVSNVTLERYSHLLGDVVSSEGDDGMYKVKIECKTFCPAKEKALTDFSYKFYKIYCVYSNGKPVTKEEIVKLPEKIKQDRNYWYYVKRGIMAFDYPDYYKNKYLDKAEKKELPVLLPVSRIYEIYTDVNCYIPRKSLYYFVRPARVSPTDFKQYINLNYIKMWQVVEEYAKRLVQKLDNDIREEIEKDKQTIVWVPELNGSVRSDGLALKNFLAKPDLDDRISLEFKLENPTKTEKKFNMGNMVFYKDGQEYPVVYLANEEGEIEGVDIKGDCERKKRNILVVKPYGSCQLTYGGKLWAKGVIIPGVDDLDNGTLNIDGFKLDLHKTTLYDLKVSGRYWK